MQSEKQVKEIEERWAKSTPGPWTAEVETRYDDDAEQEVSLMVIVSPERATATAPRSCKHIAELHCEGLYGEFDAELVANAWADISSLLEDRRELQTEVANWKKMASRLGVEQLQLELAVERESTLNLGSRVTELEAALAEQLALTKDWITEFHKLKAELAALREQLSERQKWLATPSRCSEGDRERIVKIILNGFYKGRSSLEVAEEIISLFETVNRK